MLALYGTLGLAWAALFVWLYRDDPGSHPACNAAERELISPQSGPHAPREEPSGGARSFFFAALTSPELWLISAMGIAVNVGWVFLVTWLPRYLVARHGSALAAYVESPEVLAGTLTALTGLGGMIGSIMGGTAAEAYGI